MLYLLQCETYPSFPPYPALVPLEGASYTHTNAAYQDEETSIAQYYIDNTGGTTNVEQPTSPVYWAWGWQSRWMNDLDVSCNYLDSPDHWVIYAISMAGLITWTLGVVAVGMFMLLRNNNSLHEVSVLRKYGFLYLGYERKYWFWESVKRFQQFLYRLVSTINVDVKARLVVYSLFSGGFAILHVFVQPFDDRDNQKLDSIETWALCIAFATQVFFQSLITFVLSLPQILTILLII